MADFDNFADSLPETFEGMEGFEDLAAENEEGEEVGEEANEAPQPKQSQEVQQTSKQNEQDFKNTRIPVEINGKTYMATPEDLVALAKKGAAMDSRAKTAGFMERQVQELMDRLKNADAIELLKERGMTTAQMKAQLEKYYEDLLNEENMTPEQRELRELKRFKEMEEKRAKEREEGEKKAKQEAALRQEQARITQELAEALKESKLPKHPFMGKLALQEMLSAHAHGHDLSVKDAVKLAEFTVRDQLSEFIQQMDARQLSELLGEKRIKELRGMSVAAVKNNQAAFTSKSQNIAQPQQKKGNDKPASMESFFKNLATGKK